jgi:hypothetical protein
VCALPGLGTGCVGCEGWACWHKGMFLFLPPYVFTCRDSRVYSCAIQTRLRHCATTAVTCTSATGICLPGQRTCTRVICARPITGRVGWVDGGNSVPTGIAVCYRERGISGVGEGWVWERSGVNVAGGSMCMGSGLKSSGSFGADVLWELEVLERRTAYCTLYQHL